ncbi:MAG: hypothetical protein K0Q74_1144, partial [Gammaproteobacteria bacterium]|nr:hypothetical protein [Gammaproteobacteria bacterium]
LRIPVAELESRNLGNITYGYGNAATAGVSITGGRLPGSNRDRLQFGAPAAESFYVIDDVNRLPKIFPDLLDGKTSFEVKGPESRLPNPFFFGETLDANGNVTLVGAPGANGANTTGAGKAYVLEVGPASGNRQVPVSNMAGYELTGLPSLSYLGSAVDIGGDINGDRVSSDAVIGAMGTDDNNGAVIAWFGKKKEVPFEKALFDKIASMVAINHDNEGFALAVNKLAEKLKEVPGLVDNGVDNTALIDKIAQQVKEHLVRSRGQGLFPQPLSPKRLEESSDKIAIEVAANVYSSSNQVSEQKTAPVFAPS